MKKHIYILFGLATLFAFTACNGMVEKAKEKAAETETADTGIVETKTTEAPKQKEIKADGWWLRDFRITLDWGVMGLGGTNTGMTKHVMIQRRGDAFRFTQEMSGAKADFIYKEENGEIVRYMFNPENMKANRTVIENPRNRTFDEYLKYQLSEHGLFPKKDPANDKDYKRDGSEIVAGRKCEKWVTEKNILGNISRTTALIDAECRITLKADYYMKMKDKESSGNVITVKEFTFSPNPNEVITDFSGYEMI